MIAMHRIQAKRYKKILSCAGASHLLASLYDLAFRLHFQDSADWARLLVGGQGWIIVLAPAVPW